VLFRVLFFEFGATNDGISFRYLRSFFVLGFDETGSKGGHLVFVQLDLTSRRFNIVNGKFL
jgi:hypothetical protein